MGHPKRLATYERTDSTKFSKCTRVYTAVLNLVVRCLGTAVLYSSIHRLDTVELSKTKLGTLPPLELSGIIENQNRKANLALLHDEVRILIFDDPAENERGQRP